MFLPLYCQMVAKQISEAEAQHEQEVELGSCSYSVSKLVAPCQPYPHSCLVSTCVGVVVVTLPQRPRKGVLFFAQCSGRTDMLRKAVMKRLLLRRKRPNTDLPKAEVGGGADARESVADLFFLPSPIAPDGHYFLA